MKKILKVLSVALVIAVFAITMAGCSKTGDVKSAFKKAGYEVTSVAPKDCEDLVNLLKTDEQKADLDKYEVYTFKNAERYATVVKFPSAELISEVLGASTFKTKNDGGYVNGDCYLISSCTDALYVFKNA